MTNRTNSMQLKRADLTIAEDMLLKRETLVDVDTQGADSLRAKTRSSFQMGRERGTGFRII